MDAVRVDRRAAFTIGELGQRLVVEDRQHRVADVEHDVAQRARRLVRARATLVVAKADAGQGSQRTVEEPDDPADGDGGRVGRDAVAAVRAERGPDDTAALEGRQDLLEELRREVVALGEGRERHRPRFVLADEVDQCADAVLGAAGQSHRGSFWTEVLPAGWGFRSRGSRRSGSNIRAKAAPTVVRSAEWTTTCRGSSPRT